MGKEYFAHETAVIDDNCQIGKGTKIQSHSFVCELVTIGENCFVGHGVMFINDLFKDNKLLAFKVFVLAATNVVFATTFCANLLA